VEWNWSSRGTAVLVGRGKVAYLGKVGEADSRGIVAYLESRGKVVRRGMIALLKSRDKLEAL
jgi:hypothetical protein